VTGEIATGMGSLLFAIIEPSAPFWQVCSSFRYSIKPLLKK
jgi:hypothetical protein